MISADKMLFDNMTLSTDNLLSDNIMVAADHMFFKYHHAITRYFLTLDVMW
jgi:hypothetical protein